MPTLRTAILVLVAVLAWLGQAQGQQTRTAAETWNDEYRGKAERGWDVTGFDISDVAVAQAEAQAKARGAKFNAVVADGGTFDFGVDRWDLVVSVYAGVTRFDDVFRSLRSGGVWVVEAFHRDAFGGGFRDNQLVDIFRERMTILYYEDSIGRPDLTWIYPPKDFRYVRLAARKELSK